jgi:NitT/TauT family transport system permease protein
MDTAERPYAAPLPKAGWSVRSFVFALQKVLTRTIVILLFLLVWEAAPRLGWVDPAFFPPLSRVLLAWWKMAASGELLGHFQASILRSVTGFALALLIAVPLGLIIGWYRKANSC